MIFGLDGVVTDTVAAHTAAWKTVFGKFCRELPDHRDEDPPPFTDGDYERFVAGKRPDEAAADYLSARGISVRRGSPSHVDDDTVCGLANRVRQLFRKPLDEVAASAGERTRC